MHFINGVPGILHKQLTGVSTPKVFIFILTRRFPREMWDKSEKRLIYTGMDGWMEAWPDAGLKECRREPKSALKHGITAEKSVTRESKVQLNVCRKN